MSVLVVPRNSKNEEEEEEEKSVEEKRKEEEEKKRKNVDRYQDRARVIVMHLNEWMREFSS